MDRNEKFVITINRELGSGGRTVGRLLAERLGVNYYDKAVTKVLEEKFGLSVEEIEKMKGKSSSWWSSFKSALFSIDWDIYSDDSEDQDELPFNPTSAELFDIESKTLKNIAEQESCVVAGRSAFFVLRDHPNHLNILIQASMPFRVERVMRTQHMTEVEAIKTIERIDKMRENYMKEHTECSRYDARNYQLVISADGKTEEDIVNIIMAYIG